MAVGGDGITITGAAMTHFGKQPATTVRSLAEEIVTAALADAAVDASQVGAVYFGNAVAGLLSGQEMLRGPVALRHTPLAGVPIYSVEGACATSTLAMHLALDALRAGRVDTAVVVGVEKLTHQDKARSLAAIGSAADLYAEPEVRRSVEQVLLGMDDDEDDPPEPRASAFMRMYAEQAASYLERYGATVEDFAEIAAKNHRHGAANPRAQYGADVTASQVLESRTIVAPLTLMMCAPVSDGAAALVLQADRVLDRSQRRAGVRVLAARSVTQQKERATASTVASRAARLAYEEAGIGPEDVSVVELHDAVAPAELGLYDELGLCPDGDPVSLVRERATSIGGSLPVNVSGGLVARGHPIGATGAGQLVELVDQLRGRQGPRQVSGARFGLAHNAGGHCDGDSAIAAVTILGLD